METSNTTKNQVELEAMALKKVRKIKRFYTHLVIYSIGVAVFIMKEYFNAPFNFRPLDYLNGFFIVCWTFVLTVDGLELFIREVLLGQHWEKKQIDRILESEANNQK